MQTLQAADIVLTANDKFLGKAIRFFTRSIGEPPSKVNHVGIMVNDIDIVEALAKTVKRSVRGAYGDGKQWIAVYRPRDLSSPRAALVAAKAESYVGRTYGYLKIVAHTLDWFCGGAYIFRRAACMENYPMCSWLAEHAEAAGGVLFDVPLGAASPDDIWDSVNKHKDKFECILKLQKWEA
jgi:hypothetical protein